MDKDHVLLCVLGRTASGKDHLVQKLCERAGLKQLISYTTRDRRQNEGHTHQFVSESDYRDMLANNKVAVDTNISRISICLICGWCRYTLMFQTKSEKKERLIIAKTIGISL